MAFNELSQLAVEAIASGDSNVQGSQIVVEGVSDALSQLEVSQSIVEAISDARANFMASQLCIELVTINTTSSTYTPPVNPFTDETSITPIYSECL